jgi:hypothetical protein
MADRLTIGWDQPDGTVREFTLSNKMVGVFFFVFTLVVA